MSSLNLSEISIPPWLLGLLGGLGTATPSPWAILKIQFSDQSDTDWAPAQKYLDLFTSAGSGNLVDYYGDMTHGNLDLSGSQVYGPYKIPYKRSDYAGRWVPNPPPGQINSAGLWSLAKTTAMNAGVNLNGYYGVCLTFIGLIDLFGGYLWDGKPGAFCDMGSLDVCGLAHEFGHAYGLAHSRIYGSTADYQDPWDIMSAYNVFNTPSQEFTIMGPGLNAWNMRGRGWLDESRVYTNPAASFDASVDLRPLHRRDLSGFLAAQVGDYLVEFRVPQLWDAGIPRACILVHSFYNNQSYLMYSVSGSRDIVEGDKFVFGDENFPLLGYSAAEVKKIDVPNLTATVVLHLRPERLIPPPHGWPIQPGREPLPQVEFMPGVDTLVIEDRVVKIPPYGPVRDIFKELARYLQIETSANNVPSALAARRQALEEVFSSMISLYREAIPISEPPPGYPWKGTRAPNNVAVPRDTENKLRKAMIETPSRKRDLSEAIEKAILEWMAKSDERKK